MLAAKFSIPFAVATYIIHGHAGVDAFTDKTVADERVRSLAQRITVAENPALTAMLPQKRPARVIMHLQDGRKVEQTVYSSQGGFDNPYPVNMLLEKFESLAQKVVDRKKAETIINLCQDIENIDNVEKVTHCLRPSSNN